MQLSAQKRLGENSRDRHTSILIYSDTMLNQKLIVTMNWFFLLFSIGWLVCMFFFRLILKLHFFFAQSKFKLLYIRSRFVQVSMFFPSLLLDGYYLFLLSSMRTRCNDNNGVEEERERERARENTERIENNLLKQS